MENKYFSQIKQNFGFGCMRLPMTGDEVNDEEMIKMVDHFIAEGFNYFDTAHGYLQTKSEPALKRCLTSRYPRDKYILTDKLTGTYFEKQEDIRPLFQSQLDACGVEYFDFYLMHSQNKATFEKFKACKAYETAFELKAEGKIKHVGFSFHDKPEVLDEILTTYPQIEVVQIQLNYVDFDSNDIKSGACLEVCRKHGKPVIVMEPVKGGSLINLPAEAQKVFDDLGSGSNASYAIRFAASQEGIMMVLSGMSNLEQMLDNTSYMKEFKPLTVAETEGIKKVCDIFNAQNLIPCTACRYCTDGCPMGILIPDLFACLNSVKKGFNSANYYKNVYTVNGHGKASDCVKCGQCEAICPQHLPIRDLLETVAAEFDK